jgi:hypothetical protein
VNALALLLCTLTLAGPAGPPAPAPADWDETTPAAAPPPASPPPAAEPAPDEAPATVGLDVLVPKKSSGRLLELPVALVFETGQRSGSVLEGALRFGLGYGQLSRTEDCSVVDCYPLLSISVGGVLRATTPAGAAVVGWIGLGLGFTVASNWDLNVGGGYLRADAGLDLRVGGKRVRLSTGWVEGAFTEEASSREPGPQHYLAFTLAVGALPAPAAR